MTESLKKQMVITVLTAAISMVAGFVVVYLVVGPSSSREEEMEDETENGKEYAKGHDVPQKKSINESTRGTPLNVEKISGDGTAKGEKKGDASPAGVVGETGKGEEKEPPPAVDEKPSGAGKSIVTLTDYFVFRCWQAGSDEPREKDACGKPPGIEGLVKDNLSIISKCVEEFGGKEKGKISLALKIYFSKRRYRAWLGNSTTVQGVEETSACIRQFYSGMSFKDMEHSFDTYLVFYTLESNP